MKNTLNKIPSKNCLTLIILLSVVQIGFAQSMAADSTIKKGVLSNGMTYYLHATSVVKEVASYYLIQNVGSALEEDHQMGLAHFLEHMAFNGTAAFPEKTFLRKMEANGLVFGRDINAYTSFDETVYNVNNVPTTPEMINDGLQILHDWSNSLLLTDEEIDAERGVVKEEWRTRLDGQARVRNQLSPVTYGYSKYAKRSPIGEMDVIENFKYQDLKDFYLNWYRTDLQCIAIIGDIDLEDMESKIIEKFSAIPAKANAKQRTYVSIEDNEQMQYGMGQDAEVNSSAAVFLIRHKAKLIGKNDADLKRSLMNSMIIHTINQRFQDIWMTPDAPFVRAGSGYGRFTRLHEVFSVYINPKKGQQQEAFEVAMKEVIRAKRFGFSHAELTRAKAKIINDYENYIKGLDTRSHQMIANIIMDNYLRNEPITNVASEFKLAKAYLEKMGVQDLNDRFVEIFAEKNRALMVTGVDGEKNLSEEEAHQMIQSLERDPNLAPAKLDEEEKDLLDGVALKEGSVANSEKNDLLGYTNYTLSNGIKVHYKEVDYKKNSVAVEAISPGGASLINPKDLPSSMIVRDLYQTSGIGNMTASELRKSLTGKSAYVVPVIDATTEKLVGSSSTKDIETLMQLIYLSFTKPRFDESAYDVVMESVRNQLIQLSENNRKKFKDSITVAKYGAGHPIKSIFSEGLIGQMSLAQAKKVYLERFSNPGDFEFFIVGDVSTDVIEPLLSKYLASLPNVEENEKWKDNWVDWKTNQIYKDVFLPMEQAKSTVLLNMEKDLEYSSRNDLLSQIFQRILTLRYTETLREEEGGTYGARVYSEWTKEPREMASITIYFDCNAEMVDQLVDITIAEIDKVKNGDISSEELDNTIEAIVKSRQENKQTNQYYMQVLKDLELRGYNMDDPENFEEILDSISKKDLQGFAEEISTENRVGRFILRPLE